MLILFFFGQILLPKRQKVGPSALRGSLLLSLLRGDTGASLQNDSGASLQTRSVTGASLQTRASLIFSLASLMLYTIVSNYAVNLFGKKA